MPQEGVASPVGRTLEGFDRARESFTVDWRYSPEDMDRIHWGKLPGGQEDKWLLYVMGNELYCHRSWSGILCYKAVLTEAGVTCVEVVREMPDPAWQVRMLKFLIEDQLIGLSVDPP